MDQFDSIEPLEVQRQVVLAFCTEATIPKSELTSRYSDIGPKQRFEDFMFSAINAGSHIHELAMRIKDCRSQPETIYDLAFKALLDSPRSRSGKLVNHGLLETMFPTVTARLVYGGSGKEVFADIPKVLEAAGLEDVRQVALMRHEVYSRSNKKFKRTFPFHKEGSNLIEHYEFHRTVAHRVSCEFVGQLLSGAPLAAEIYQHLENRNGLFSDRLVSGYESARAKSDLPPGAIADFCAMAIYVYISCHPDAEIV